MAKTQPPKPPQKQSQSQATSTIQATLDEFATFPIQTEEVSYAPSATDGRQTGVESPGRLVEGTVRDVLGWRPRTNDPRAVLAALTQSFSAEEVQGYTQYHWTPKSYTVQVQADLGAVTGAQASIYTRARHALDEALPLLDGLYHLSETADAEDTEAIRTIVRTMFSEVVNELGTEGGPRLARVDDLLSQLLGGQQPSAGKVRGETVQGHLGKLRDKFGLERVNVNTIPEEQNLTNFYVVVDYICDIDHSWREALQFFDRQSTAKGFLGTQLVLLSRFLAVVVESVHEVEFAMDSVFLRHDQRSTILLTVGSAGPTAKLYVSELLSWIERFASEEAPRLFQDAGKEGVRTVRPTLRRLQGFVADIASRSQTGVPSAFNTRRVSRAWNELNDQMKNAVNEVNRIV